MMLQEWMTAKGLNDAKLAEKLGGKLSRSQISRIRRNKSTASPEAARVLEAVTRIPAAKFVMGEVA